MHDILEKLKNLALRRHHVEEGDGGFHSCPMSEGWSRCDFVKPNICNCGADSHNAKVEAAIKELKEELATIYAFRRRGQPGFVTCQQWRYNELSQNSQFETIMLYGPASKVYKLYKELA